MIDKLCLLPVTKWLISTSRYMPNSLIQQRVPNCAVLFCKVVPADCGLEVWLPCQPTLFDPRFVATNQGASAIFWYWPYHQNQKDPVPGPGLVPVPKSSLAWKIFVIALIIGSLVNIMWPIVTNQISKKMKCSNADTSAINLSINVKFWVLCFIEKLSCNILMRTTFTVEVTMQFW